MVVVILSDLGPCHDFFTVVKGLGGGTGRGRMSPQRRECVRECADLEGKQKGERPFSSCDSLSHIYRNFLAPFWPVCHWSVFVFPMICSTDKHTLLSVSVRLWGQQTPVYKVSLLCDMQEKKSLSVLSLFFSVPDCLHAVTQIVPLP